MYAASRRKAFAIIRDGVVVVVVESQLLAVKIAEPKHRILVLELFSRN